MWLARRRRSPLLQPRSLAVPTRPSCRGSFRRHAAAADLALVEGNKGLYDGLALDGSNSNAALADDAGPAGAAGASTRAA
ncbi:MAG: hypothetical protein V9F01_02810 [Chitinophagaceae bacterium]